MRKPTICIGEHKGTDQLCSNCTADQRLYFRYTDSAIPLLLKSEISLRLCFHSYAKCWFSHDVAHLFFGGIVQCFRCKVRVLRDRVLLRSQHWDVGGSKPAFLSSKIL